MKVLKNYVLVEQIFEEKDKQIILPGATDDEQKYNITFAIKDLGPDCTLTKEVIGQIPIFTQYVSFHASMKIEERRSKKHSYPGYIKMNSLVNEEDIIAIMTQEEYEKSKK